MIPKHCRRGEGVKKLGGGLPRERRGGVLAGGSLGRMCPGLSDEV